MHTSGDTSSHTECADSLLTDMKAHLKQASSESFDEFNLPIPVAKNVYSISNERLEWRKLTNADFPKELGPLSSAAIDELPADFSMKVSLYLEQSTSLHNYYCNNDISSFTTWNGEHY